MMLFKQSLVTQLCTLSLLSAQLLVSHAVIAATYALETISVTASRNPQSLADIAASMSVVNRGEITLVSATHVSELLARVPGVWVARGNGQEHLTAIRSPVLTGAGSCGSFAVTEEGIPVRATGFCNVNQLFDTNTEQAGQIDVLRGPGTVLFGSDAQHGVINIMSQSPSDEPSTEAGIEAGANDYVRFKLGHSDRSGEHAFRVAINAAHDGGYKDDAGFDQQKMSLRHDYASDDISLRTLFSATNLNQETAGYVSGTDAYKDEHRKRENPNPEAFRDSQSARLQTRIELAQSNGELWSLTPFFRYTDMTFMMHFLPGTPVEQNGHQSLGFQSAYVTNINEAFSLNSGIDVELTDAWLTQTQAQGFSSFPKGKQYDYAVAGLTTAVFTAFDYASTERTRYSGGMRYEVVRYDYHNEMISGNSAEDSSLCVNGMTGAVGCRYTRPEDSQDSFGNLSANMGVIHNFSSDQAWFSRLAVGHRPPQATEMYRLQNGQMQANLESESVQSIELGLRGKITTLSYSVTAFAMEKDHVIFQSSQRLNVSEGKTSHRGIEYDLSWPISHNWDIGLSGSYAQHQYQANVSEPGSNSTIATKGNDAVSAPRHMNNLRLGWHPNNTTTAELELQALGEYYTDIENAHAYEGHNLVNLRLQHQLSDTITIGARIKNLTDIDYAERADFSAFGGDRYFIGEPRSLFVSLDVSF